MQNSNESYFFPSTQPLMDNDKKKQTQYSANYITPWQENEECKKYIQNGKK